MGTLTKIIESSLGIPAHIQVNLFATILVVLLLWLIRLTIIKIVNKRTEDVRTRYIWRKTTTYVVAVVGILIIGRIWFIGFQTLTTFIGIFSAGLAIALKDAISNFAGWIYISWRRPFIVGDRIQIGDFAGDVIDINMFDFTLLEIGNWVKADQSTGRMLHIPNGKVFVEPVANYSQGFPFIWNEIPVLLSYESNWRKAKEILYEIIEQHTMKLSQKAEQKIREASEKFLIYYKKLSPIIYTTTQASGILLTLRYLCPPRERRGSEDAIWREILSRFAEHDDIELAYPTTRIYSRLFEKQPAKQQFEESSQSEDSSEDKPAK